MPLSTENLNIGDRVLVGESWGWHSVLHKPGTVTRKSPSGIATIAVDAYPSHGSSAHEVVFDKHGRERGKWAQGRELARFSQQVLDDESHRDLVARKRSMLEDFNLWRSKLGDDAILKIAEIVDSELAKG